MNSITLLNTLSGVTLALALLLGLAVYLSDRTRKVNRNFLYQVFGVGVWVFCNMMADRAISADWMLIWSKLTIVGPMLFAYFFYRMSTLFPREKVLNPAHEWAVRAGLIGLLLFVPTRYNIAEVYLESDGSFAIHPGILYLAFFLYLLVLLITSFRTMFAGRKALSSQERSRVAYVGFGVGLTIFISAITNGILPVLGYSNLANYGPYSIIIFISFTAYAIVRYHLFGIRVVATQLFVISLCVFTLAQMFIVETVQQKFVNGLFFTLSAVFGMFLIRSVQHEVENREKNERLARYLANANARLRELDKQKTEFVSIASHQLRAPVAAIRGYTSLIVEGSFGEVPKKFEEPLYRVVESGKRLSLMIDDFLNVTRIEQGRMTYHNDRLNLGNLLEIVFQELRLSAEKKGLAFTISYPSGEPVWIVGDEGKLKQIFSNLIDNSIKYTQKGAIAVTLRRLDTHHAAIVEIKDTGIGISAEDQEQLFHKFSRATNANDANVYGTGLGLYIAKEIIRAHRGWIHVSSPGVGKGSTFSVEIPYAPPETAAVS
jgi:signal transduction histidine kinase